MTDEPVKDEPREEKLSDLELDDQIGALDKGLRWGPRDRTRSLKRAVARLESAKARAKLLGVREAEATFKAHKYRWVPWLGASWAKELEERNEAHEAAKAQVKWLEFQLEKAKRRAAKRQNWEAAHAFEIQQRNELGQERSERVEGFGKERLEQIKAQGGTKGWDFSESQAWVRRQGEAEWRRRVAAERQERLSHVR